MSGLHDVHDLAGLTVSLLWLQAEDPSKEWDGQEVAQKVEGGN
jgi:hypothetical protein